MVNPQLPMLLAAVLGCASVAGVAVEAQCGASVVPNTCFEHAGSSQRVHAKDAADCCAKCVGDSNCLSYTFIVGDDPKKPPCHLKSTLPYDKGTPCNGTSGTMHPAPAPSPTRPPPPAPKGAPHILLLYVDEMDGRVLDPNHPQVKPPTPTLDALIDSGVHFSQAYCESQQCVPSRSSVLAGRRTDQIRVYDNAAGIVSVGGNQSRFDPHCVKAFGQEGCSHLAQMQTGVLDDGTFIDRLAAFGYNISLYGKMHAGAGLDRYPGAVTEFPFSSSSKLQKEWARPLGSAIGMKGAKQGAANAYNVPDNVAKPASPGDYAATASCVEALNGGLFAKPTPPQFLYCSIIVPHPPYKSNSTYMDRVKDLNVTVVEQVPKSDYHPNDLFTSVTKRTYDTDSVSAKEIEHFRRVYFSMITEADSLMGEIVSALDNSEGHPRNNTFIIFMSDHGEDNTEHRQVGKNNQYDSAGRVPLILSGPGIDPGTARIDTLVSLNDIYPTIMAAAKIPEPQGLAGSSLLDLVPSWDGRRSLNNRTDFVIAQYHSVYSVTGQFMLRQGDWKLIAFGDMPAYEDNFEPQLFNLAEDPWELHDVASANPTRVDTMLALLNSSLDYKDADAKAKEFNQYMFKTFALEKGCYAAMTSLFGADFNASDAEKAAAWLNVPCHKKMQ